jgi:hypothetical protein
MAPPPPLTIVDPYAWERSSVTRLALGELVSAGQLAANEEGRPAEWIVPPADDRTPNPPDDYVVSFIRFHERGFAAPASRFMRALCHRYGVELHNFAPNAISQAAMFVGVGEGYLGIPVNWDLWVHLFRAELFTQPTTEQRTRRAVRAGGMSLALRGQYKDDYIPCTMTTNNAGWERGGSTSAMPSLASPLTPAWCSGRSPTPGATGCPRSSIGGGWTRSWPR